MTKVLTNIQTLRQLEDPTSFRQFVVQISAHEQDFFLLKPGNFPAALPQGEKLPFLKSIPTSTTFTGLVDAPKQTSQSIIVCVNPNNVFGPVLNRTKLMLNAAVRVYVLFSTWGERITLLRGYVYSFQLSDDFRITVNS